MTKANRPINHVWMRIVGEHAILNSTYGSVHGDGSLHPRGDGEDFAIYYANNKPYSQDLINLLIGELKKELGPDFDVVLEVDHIHVEYDPK